MSHERTQRVNTIYALVVYMVNTRDSQKQMNAALNDCWGENDSETKCQMK